MTKTTTHYWPLDFDPEVEVYDALPWGLPGHRKQRQKTKDRRQRRSLSIR